MSKIYVRNAVQTVPMFRFAILIIAGIVLGDACNDVVDARIWLLMMALCVAVSILVDKHHPITSSIMLLAGVGMMGAVRIGIANVRGYELTKAKEHVKCDIAIVSEPIVRGKVIQFDGLFYGTENETELVGKRVRVSVLRDTITGHYKTLHIGDGLRTDIDLAPLQIWYRENQHFDYLRWLKMRGFSCRGFVGIGKWEKENVNCKDIGMLEMTKLQALVFRQKVLERIKSSGIDEEAYAVATAMALGNKASLTPKIHEEYNIAGVSHILALSGVHLTIINIILMSVFGVRRLRGQLLILLLIWGYVVFTGMSISIIRAAVMLTVWQMLSTIARRQKSLNVLGFTACLMVMVNPLCVFDVGFQMSFAAVLAIVCLMEPFREIMPRKIIHKTKEEREEMTKKEKVVDWLLRNLMFTITVSLSAQIGTLPLSIYYFGRIPLLFLLTNLVMLLAVLLIIPTTLAMAFLQAIDMAAGFNSGVVSYAIGKVLSGIVWGTQRMLEIIAHLPWASIEGVSINIVQVVALYVLITAGVVYVNRRRF